LSQPGRKTLKKQKTGRGGGIFFKRESIFVVRELKGSRKEWRWRFPAVKGEQGGVEGRKRPTKGKGKYSTARQSETWGRGKKGPAVSENVKGTRKNLKVFSLD